MLVLPHPVVLASGSPRRKELLASMGVEFEVVGANVDETSLITEDPWETAVCLAQAKAEAVFAKRPEALVIGGDTVVAVPKSQGDYEQLGKPRGKREAKWMLGELSGKEHVVITGVCVSWPDGQHEFSETTHVWFRRLSKDEIAEYVSSGEPMDKAGAYAIQGGAKEFVERLEGSLTNVVGLPVEALESFLRSMQRPAVANRL